MVVVFECDAFAGKYSNHDHISARSVVAQTYTGSGALLDMDAGTGETRAADRFSFADGDRLLDSIEQLSAKSKFNHRGRREH